MQNPLPTIAGAVGHFLNNIVPAYKATYTAAPESAKKIYTVRGVPVTDNDLQTARNVLFAEISNRNPDRQKLEARTILNTALNRIPQYQARGRTLDLNGVLTAPNQYQGYGSPEYKRILSNGTTTVDSQKLSSIDDVLGEVKSGNFPDTTGNRVYYSHNSAGQIFTRPGGIYQSQTPSRSMAGLSMQ